MSDICSLSSLFNDITLYRSPCENYQSLLESIDKTKSKNPNLIFFLDWDDTCLPSSILEEYGLFSSQIPVPDNVLYSLKKCEEMVRQILLSAKLLTDHVYIITNSTNNWVSYSLNRFYPTLQNDKVIEGIPIFYAREHDKLFSDPMIWKYRTMVDILDRVVGSNILSEENKECKMNMQRKVKVVSIGDSTFERNALHQIGSERSLITTKIIKMLEFPETIDHLYIQLIALRDVLEPISLNIDPCDLMTYVDTIGENTLIKIVQNNQRHKSIEFIDKNIFKNDHSNWFDRPINMFDNTPGLHGWHYRWAEHWKSYYEQKALETNNNCNGINKIQTENDNYTIDDTPHCVFFDRYGLDLIDEREKRDHDFDDSDLDQIISDFQTIDLNSDVDDAM